jgi:F-type H+-transporting ATPase subunit b
MFEINGTFFVFIALFLGFMYLFNEIALKPVGQIIATRNKLIADDLAAAEDNKTDAAAVIAAYEERMQSSRLEGQRIIQEALQSAQAKRNEELKILQNELQTKIDKIRVDLAEERIKLVAELVDPEKELVEQIVKKLLGESAGLPSVVIDRLQVQKALEEAS